MVTQEKADAIRLMVLGSLLAEYGARLIIDDTQRDLKMRIRNVINSVKNVENYFIGNPNATTRYRQEFRKAFNKNETVLLAELNLTCWDLTEEGLEEIISAVKKVIVETPQENNQ